MVSLNREFLVPYLQNVCSLHLALRKIEQKIRKLNYLIFEAENSISVEKPQRKDYVQEKNKAYYALTAIGCVVTVFSAMFFALNIIGGTQIGLSWTVSGVAVGLLLVVLPRLFANARRETNRRIDQEYAKAYDQFRIALAEATEKSSNTVSKLKMRVQEWEQQKKIVDNLLQMAYAVELIPMPCRNIYYAVYLYEWICTSRSDDLEQALRSFNPEEHQEKLNHIIATQSDAILVHTKSIADQFKTFVAQKQQEVVLRAKVEDMDCDPEEKEMYRSIVDVNLDSTAYFAAADYLIQI